MIGDDRSRASILKVDQQQINEQLRKLSDQIARIEGRSGGINLRDSITIKSEKQTLIDFESTTSGNASIVAYGTENATIAFAKGARKEDNGEWIATDTSATIWALDRSGNGVLYADSGLTVGQAFNPTLAFTFGTGGSYVLKSGDTMTGALNLVGVSTAVTAAAGTSTTQIATTAFVTTADNLKANLASPTFTGTPAAPTAAVGTSTTQLATTAFVDAEAVAKTGDTMTGDLTITSAADNPNDNIVIANTNANSAAGGFRFQKLSASPAADDTLGNIRFAGYDSGNNLTNFARITGISTVLTDGSEEGKIELGVASGGAVAVLATVERDLFKLTSATTVKPTLTVENTNADADSAEVIIYKNSASPANNDTLGYYRFKGNSSTGVLRTFASMYGFANNVTNAAEYGVFYFQTLSAGSNSLGAYIAGPDLYVYGNMSALTITDRTKAPKDKAESYAIIDSFDRKNGELDKDKLDKAAKIEFDDFSDPTKASKKSTARDLSMVVSALMEVTKDLAARVAALENP